LPSGKLKGTVVIFTLVVISVAVEPGLIEVTVMSNRIRPSMPSERMSRTNVSRYRCETGFSTGSDPGEVYPFHWA
jgi:hypothetical protein